MLTKSFRLEVIQKTTRNSSLSIEFSSSLEVLRLPCTRTCKGFVSISRRCKHCCIHSPSWELWCHIAAWVTIPTWRSYKQRNISLTCSKTSNTLEGIFWSLSSHHIPLIVSQDFSWSLSKSSARNLMRVQWICFEIRRKQIWGWFSTRWFAIVLRPFSLL